MQFSLIVGKRISSEELAQIACEIEIDILNSPIGKQDQYAAAYGGLNFISFYSDESVKVSPLPIAKEIAEKLSKNLLLFFTGLSSDSNAVLSEQKKNTVNNKSVKTNLDTMTFLSRKFKDAIQQGKIDRVGSILHEGWINIIIKSKKRLATKITNQSIDQYYNKAIQLGAKVGENYFASRFWRRRKFLLFYCRA